MFWIKTIKTMNRDQKNINLEMAKKLRTCEEWIEALKLCTKSDRNDINTLINMVKKQNKKGK